MSSASNLPQKVLIVDSDQSVINSIAAACSKHGITTVTANSWENALYQFNNNKFDAAIVELEMDQMKGPVLLQKWRNHEVESKRDCAFILVAGKAYQGTVNALGVEIGDTMFTQKPIKELPFISMLAKAYQLKKSSQQFLDIKEKLIAPLIKKGDAASMEKLAEEKLMVMGKRGQELAAEVFESANKIPKALNTYKGLNKSNPQNMKYLNEIGRLEMQQGNIAEAQKYYEQADKIAPDQIARLREMGRMYMQLKMPEKGMEKYKRLMEIDPEVAQGDEKFDIFEEIQECGYDDYAAQLCGLHTKPLELIRHYNNKGVAYSKVEKFVDAIDEYQKAQRLMPDSKELYRILFNEAIAHVRLNHEKHFTAAVELLHQCLKMKPDFTKAQDRLKALEAKGYKLAS